MSEYQAFLQGIPDLLLRWIDPHRASDPAQIRHALALTIVSFLIATCVRLLWHTGQLVFGLLRGRRAIQPAGNWAVLRVIIGFLAIALPWAALFAVHAGWPLPTRMYSLSGMAAALWLALKAADHRSIWLDMRNKRLVLRQGLFAQHAVSRSLQISDILQVVQPVVGQKLVSAVTGPAWLMLVDHFGNEATARAYLGRVAKAAGVRLAKRFTIIA